MPRPLTAADRVPQVGDVLESPEGYRVDVLKEPELVPGRGYKVTNIFGMTEGVSLHWKYAHRADSGPITIEDS